MSSTLNKTVSFHQDAKTYDGVHHTSYMLTNAIKYSIMNGVGKPTDLYNSVVNEDIITCIWLESQENNLEYTRSILTSFVQVKLLMEDLLIRIDKTPCKPVPLLKEGGSSLKAGSRNRESVVYSITTTNAIITYLIEKTMELQIQEEQEAATMQSTIRRATSATTLV